MKAVVVGAGYAGVIAANRLARHSGIDVTVVNPREVFVERVRLHQHLACSGTAVTPLSDVLGPGVAVRVATAERIDDGVVRLASGGDLEFDRLVYAPGGAVAAAPGTIGVGSLESADAGRTALRALPGESTVTVVGGGLTGIETAAEVAEARPDLRVRLLSEGPIGASLGEGARARVMRELARLGVTTVRGLFDPRSNAGLVLWAIADRVSDLGLRSGLEVDAVGRVRVDEFLRSASDPRIVAVGDAAGVSGARPNCRTALPQGVCGADNVIREMRGRPPRPYDLRYAAQNVSLGRASAVVQLTRKDDSPTRFVIGGRPAAIVKEQVCRFAKWAPSRALPIG